MATELTDKRTLNTKTFDLGKGKFESKIHSTHVHYKNRDGLDDIDITLVPTDNGWEMKKASYEVEIPRYCDDWFRFTNKFAFDPWTEEEIKAESESFKMKPERVEHIEGRVEGNDVVYRDAFGTDIDLVIRVNNEGLDKLVVIRKKPVVITDLEFKFELDIPSNFDFQVKKNSYTREEQEIIDIKKEDSLYYRDQIKAKEAEKDYKKARQDSYNYDISLREWDKAKRTTWDKTTTFPTINSVIFGKDKQTWFRDFRVWDSGKIVEPCEVSLSVEGGKIYLKKKITSAFQEKATYPIYTDDTTNFNVGSQNGYCTASPDGNWNNAHDATSGSSSIVTDNNFPGGGFYNTQFYIYRAFLPFDTSGLVDGTTVTGAKLYIYVSTVDNAEDGQDWYNVMHTSQSNPELLSGADYDQCGAVDNPDEGATRIDSSDFVATAWNYFTLNATGLGWVSKTSWTLLGIREGHDCVDEAYTTCWNNLNFDSSRKGGGTHIPYLAVTWGAGGTTAGDGIFFGTNI